MRYDTKLWICKQGDKTYDKDTGNYTIGDEQSVCVYCGVMDTRDTLMPLIYGKLIEGSKTINTQRHIDEPFDYLRIGEPGSNEYKKIYALDWTRYLRNKQVLVVHEQQQSKRGLNDGN